MKSKKEQRLLFLMDVNNEKKDPKRYVCTTNDVSKFLEDVTLILKLDSKAKILYSKDRTKITNIDDIKSGDTIYVSTGIEIKRSNKNLFSALLSQCENLEGVRRGSSLLPERSSSAKTSTKVNVNNAFPHSRRKNSVETRAGTSQLPHRPPLTRENLERLDTVKSSKVDSKDHIISDTHDTQNIDTNQVNQTPYGRYNQLIISQPGSVEDHLVYSMFESYRRVPSGYRESIDGHEEISKSLMETQFKLFAQLLSFEKIVLPQVTNDIGKSIFRRCTQIYDEVDIEDIRFTITGPEYTGKTTILSMLAYTFFVKLQHTSEKDSVFIFPFNVMKNENNLSHPRKLYNNIIKVITDFLMFTRFEIWNSFYGLREWLFSIPFVGQLTSFPQSLNTVSNIDTTKLVQVAKKIHEVFHKKNVETDDIMCLLFSLPQLFSDIFNFKRILYVIDHYDLLSKSNHKILSNIIASNPFLIAAKDEDRLTQFLINTQQTNSYSTENFVDYNTGLSIVMRKIPLVLDCEDMFGYPTLTYWYDDIIKELQRDLKITGGRVYGGPRPLAPLSRVSILRTKLEKLLKVLLLTKKVDKFNPDDLVKISSVDDIEVCS